MLQSHNPDKPELAKIDHQSQAHELIANLSYFPSLHDNAKQWFISSIATMLRLGKSLNLFELEHKYNFLERYKDFPQLVINSNQGADSITYRDIYQSAMAPQWASAVSFQAIYERLASANELKNDDIRRLLDLGAGYWNSAITFDVAFKNLQTAIGIEWSSAKLSLYKETNASIFALNQARFRPLVGNFFDLGKTASDLSTAMKDEDKFDLVIIQSYFPEGGNRQGHSTLEYLSLFGKLAELLTENGRLVITIDQRDYALNHELNLLKPQLLANFRNYQDARITPSGHFGMPSELAVDVWVADSSILNNLQQSSNI